MNLETDIHFSVILILQETKKFSLAFWDVRTFCVIAIFRI